MKRLWVFVVRKGFPLAVAVIVAGILFVALFLAFDWYRQPFIGAFIEPNMVVSQIGNEDWPAKRAGVQWPDRLLAVDKQPVTTPSELKEVLIAKGFAPLELSLEQRDGTLYQVTVTPRPVRPGELVTQFIVPYLVGVIFFLSGLWVYRLGGDQRPGRAFLLFATSISITTGAYLDVNTTHRFTLIWTLSLYGAGGSLAYLALVFPRQLPFFTRYPAARNLPWVVALPIALIGMREILFPSNPWGYIQPWIRGYTVAALAIVLFLGMQVVRIVRSTSPVRRQQSRIIIFGATLAFGPMLLFYLIPISFGPIPEFQSAFFFPPLIFFLLSVAYAIVRYRLLDVDRVLSQAVTYLVTSAVAFSIFYLVITGLSLILHESINPTNPMVVALYLFLLVILLNPLRTLAQSVIDRLFYRTHADYRKVLSTISRELVISPNVTRTLNFLERELTLALQPKHLVLYLYDDDDALYRRWTPDGGTRADQRSDLNLLPESALLRLLNRIRQAVWLPPGQPYPPELSAEVAFLKTMDCPVYVPLHYEGRLIGFLGLGERLSGVPYSSDDLEFLNAGAAQSSLALENARLFTNLQDTLEETMEMKNLMDDIFASIASGVITTDMERRITLFNRASEHILGIPARQVLGQSVQSVMTAVGPHLEMMAKTTIREGGITIDDEFSPTLPDRGDLYLRLSCAPLRDAHQDTKGAAIVIDDLTEKHQLEAEQERIRRTFGRVVAPRVRDRLLSDPSSLRLDGTRQLITMLFADIHGFTPLSERSQPETLFEVLNSYLSLAARMILYEEGTLDKFMGDAVMAMWNAPDKQEDHTLRAVRAALAVNRVISTHRQSLEAAYRLHFSIGITRGEAMVGNVGTSELFNYTAIGDTVNLAQRLEAAAEPEQILLSQTAYQAVAEHVIAQQLPPIRVKGRKQEEIVYELKGLKNAKDQGSYPT